MISRYTRADGARIYTCDGYEYPSVSTILHPPRGDRYESAGMSRGTWVHAMIETLLAGRVPHVVPEHAGFAENARTLLADIYLDRWRTELPLVSRWYGFGGTLDLLALCRVRGGWWIYDWKTREQDGQILAKGVRGQWGPQMSAYAELAEEYLGEPVAGARVGVIYPDDRGATMWEIDRDELRGIFRAKFLPKLKEWEG